MQEELSILLQAQYPLIYLMTYEEERSERALAKLVKSQPNSRRLYSWTVTHGMVEHGQSNTTTQHNTVSPEAAVEWIVRQKESGVYVLKDFHPYITAPGVVRWLRNAIASFKQTGKTIILMSPVYEMPPELEKEVVVLDFPLPSVTELDQVLSGQLSRGPSKALSPLGREKLLKAALGLTHDEAEKVYRKAYVTAGKLTETEVAQPRRQS